MGCLFRLFSLLILLGLFGLPAAAVYYGLDRLPTVATSGSVGPAEMRQAMMIGARLATAPLSASGGGVTLNASELNVLVRGWAARAPNVDARAAVTRFGVLVGASAELPIPENPLGRYVNIAATVAPSRTGLVVDRLAIGRIEVPQAMIHPLVKFLLDQAAGPGQGETIFGAVHSVAINGQRVTIGLARPPSPTRPAA
jgi:hypothetical protein